jgi:hypothetical protein
MANRAGISLIKVDGVSLPSQQTNFELREKVLSTRSYFKTRNFGEEYYKRWC